MKLIKTKMKLLFPLLIITIIFLLYCFKDSKFVPLDTGENQNNDTGNNTIKPECNSNDKCDDQDDCTVDTCDLNHKCIHTRTCSCTSSEECDDSNPCTDDSCNSNKCVYTNNQSGDQCVIDGNNYFCDGKGQCVQCVESSHCPTTEPCIKSHCKENVCTPYNYTGPPDEWSMGKEYCVNGISSECLYDEHCTHKTKPTLPCAINVCSDAVCIEDTHLCECTKKEDCSGDQICDINGHCIGDKACETHDNCDEDRSCYTECCDDQLKICQKTLKPDSNTCKEGYRIPKCINNSDCSEYDKDPFFSCSTRVCSNGYCKLSYDQCNCVYDEDCSKNTNECAEPKCNNGLCEPNYKDCEIECTGDEQEAPYMCNGAGSCIPSDDCSSGGGSCGCGAGGCSNVIPVDR